MVVYFFRSRLRNFLRAWDVNIIMQTSAESLGKGLCMQRMTRALANKI